MRAFSPVVDQEAASGAQREGDPVFPTVQVLRQREKEGARLFPIHDLLEDADAPAGGDDVWDAEAVTFFAAWTCSSCAHPDGVASSVAAASISGVISVTRGMSFAFRSRPGSGRRDFCARQVDDEVRLDDVGDHRGQVVVVAEFDFIDGYRVVFVDDRDHPQSMRVKRVLRMFRKRLRSVISLIVRRTWPTKRPCSRRRWSRPALAVPGDRGRRLLLGMLLSLPSIPIRCFPEAMAPN